MRIEDLHCLLGASSSSAKSKALPATRQIAWRVGNGLGQSRAKGICLVVCSSQQ